MRRLTRIKLTWKLLKHYIKHIPKVLLNYYKEVGDDSMDYNLISCCHKCKEQIFHYRYEEDKTILPFYKAHKYCAKEDINNVQTFMDNNGNDPKWCDRPEAGGYKYSSLQN